jgi:HK97 family phage major capsid protein/HK97 family phage prohead protease
VSTENKIARIMQEKLERTFEVRSVNAEERTVDLAFSSEAEYERWWGVEILGHDAGEVRMDRLKSGAALLVNHRSDDQVGVVESARIDKDGKGRATVRFGKSARASEILQDVIDGIRKLVSVGYHIHAAKLVETREGGIDVYRITDWEPVEISIVSVPADPSVGVGRSVESPREEAPRVSVEAPREQQPNEEKRMADQEPKIDVTAERKAAVEEEQTRTATILKIGEQYKTLDPKALEVAAQAVRDGKSVSEFQAELLKRLNERTTKPIGEQHRATEIGLTEKEAKQFSFMRAIRFLADKNDPKAREEAAFEIECSKAAQDAAGKPAQGIMVPADVLGRGFSSTTPAGGPGSNIIATDLLSGSFIEMLRKRSFAMQRGRKLAGLVGNVDIPRQKSGNTAYWVGEGSAPTAGELGVDNISLTPKTVGAYSDITRKMLIQSSPDAEALTRDDIIKTLALAIDNAALYGSGAANQPRGVKNYAGINAVDFVAAGAPTFAELVKMETEIAADNADLGSLAYVIDAAMRGYLKTLPKFGSGTEATVWEQGGTVNGYECAVTNQVTTGDVFFGNWDDLLIAMWSGLDLTVDPYALSTSGGVRVIAFQDLDFNLRHVESFCYGVMVP